MLQKLSSDKTFFGWTFISNNVNKSLGNHSVIENHFANHCGAH